LIALFLFFALVGLPAQEPPAAPPSLDFFCPMDPDVRTAQPGRCSRCGMALRVGVPEAIEYPVQLTLKPKIVRPDRPVELSFRVRDPKTGIPVQEFEVLHEKLFHLFIVSEDLSHFEHEHPTLSGDHTFRYKTQFPKPGMYRLLSDFYPKGGTPQLIERTVLVSASKAATVTPPQLTADLSAKRGDNIDVELTMEPAIPIAGMKTLMFFRIKPADGLEQYLGAWGHMLAVSDDLVDTIHNHPFLADGGPQVQFNLVFPRARTYRVWVQFQRKGVVNTVSFTIPVSTL
jgi:hypothetical protein